MHFKSLVGISLATLAVARSSLIQDRDANHLERRAEANLPTIKQALDVSGKAIADVDASIKALNAQNAGTQVGAINEKLIKLSSDVSSQAKKLNSSGPIGVTEVLGLVSQSGRSQYQTLILTLASGLNSTVRGIIEKKDIIKDSGKADVLTPGLKAQRKSIVDIISIIPGQVPTALVGTINQALGRIGQGGASSSSEPGAPPSPPPLPLPFKPELNALSNPALLDIVGTVIDEVMNQVIGVLKGTQAGLNLPTLPPGLLVPGGAAKPPPPPPPPAASPAQPPRETTASGTAKPPPPASTPMDMGMGMAPKGTGVPDASPHSDATPKGKGKTGGGLGATGGTGATGGLGGKGKGGKGGKGGRLSNIN